MGFVVVFPCHFVGLSVKETQIATSLSSELDGVAIPSVPVVNAKRTQERKGKNRTRRNNAIQGRVERS